MDQGRSDPHTVLGVPAGAAATMIRRAYRRQVRRTHPDTGGSAAEFRKVQLAWEALRDRQDGPDADRVSDDSADGPCRASGPQQGASRGVWAARAPGGGEWPAVSVMPGRWAWLSRVVYVLVSLALTAAGLALVRPTADPDGFLGVGWAAPGPVWTVAWAVTVLVVGLATVRGRVSGGLVVLLVLVLFATIGQIGTWWWWGLVGWTVASLVLPVVQIVQFRPMWSVRQALDDGPVFGTPAWQHRASAELVEQLTVIPAVRVFHQERGAAHVVVCGDRVAAVGAPAGWEFPGIPTARVWPLSVVEDPAGALDEMASWLLGGGGTTVDRRVLADLDG